MKYILLTIILCVSFNFLSAQSIDSLGLYDIPLLNRQEAAFFEKKFEGSNLPFDFNNKKVAYFIPRKGFMEKSAFFKVVKTYQNKGFSIIPQIIVLTEKERIEHGGFDAIILLDYKMPLGKRLQKRILEDFKKSKPCRLC